MDVLTIENLEKSFKKRKVIDGVSFSVPEGSVFGFIGRNGAGKTTTMKMVLGLLRPDGGEISVCGEPVAFGRAGANGRAGYLPDVPEFYGHMTPREYLSLCAELTGMGREEAPGRIGEMLGLVGLEDGKKRISAFSRGMKQRLGIAQALLNRPRLLICDEPTSALDPIGRKDILDILLRVRGDTTVIFSTHILADVERICDRLVVLEGGKIALSGPINELKSRQKPAGMALEFEEREELDAFLALGPIRSLRRELSPSGTAVRVFTDGAVSERGILNAVASGGLLPLRLELIKPTIESLFLEALQ